MKRSYTFDLDNDSTKGNETDYDMSLRGAVGQAFRIDPSCIKYPALKGNPKFDGCFQWNNWRQIDELMYMPHDQSYDSFFNAGGPVFISCLMKMTTIIAGNALRCTTRCTALVAQRN